MKKSGRICAKVLTRKVKCDKLLNHKNRSRKFSDGYMI